MFNFQVKTTIYNSEGLPKVVIPVASEVEIMTSRNTYTDTAKVVVPNKNYRKTNAGIKDYVNVGDRLTIQMRYVDLASGVDPMGEWNGNVEFDGYVSKITPDTNATIYCEDEAFKLKRISLDAKHFKGTTFSEVMAYLAPDYERVVQDAKVGDFRVTGSVTPLDAFDALRKNFGTFIYFRGKTLYCETLYEPNDENRTLILNSQLNVPLGGESLTFVEESDLRAVAKVVSVNDSGTDIVKYYYYDESLPSRPVISTKEKVLGNVSTYKIPNITEADMDVLGSRYLRSLWYTRTTGEMETFGQPSFKHGDTARIVNGRVPERDGDYRVYEITKSFTPDNGYRQLVKLGRKL